MDIFEGKREESSEAARGPDLNWTAFSVLSLAAFSFFSPAGPAHAQVNPQQGVAKTSTARIAQTAIEFGSAGTLSMDGMSPKLNFTASEVPKITDAICADLAKKNPSLLKDPASFSELKETLGFFFSGLTVLLGGSPPSNLSGADLFVFSQILPGGGQAQSSQMLDVEAMKKFADRLQRPFGGVAASDIVSSIKALCNESLYATSQYSIGTAGSITARYGLFNGNGMAAVNLGGRTSRVALSYDRATGSFNMQGLSIGNGNAASLSLVPKPVDPKAAPTPPCPGFIDWNNCDARIELGLKPAGRVSYTFNPASDAFEGMMDFGTGKIPAQLSLKETPVPGKPGVFTKTWSIGICDGMFKGAVLNITDGKLTGSFGSSVGKMRLSGQTDQKSVFTMNAALEDGSLKGTSWVYNPSSDALEGILSIGSMTGAQLQFVKNDAVADPKVTGETVLLHLRAGPQSPRDLTLEYQLDDPAHPFRGSLSTDAGNATVSLALLKDGTRGLSAAFPEGSLLKGTWSWNPDKDSWDGTIDAGRLIPAEVTISRIQSQTAGQPATDLIKLHLLSGPFKGAMLNYSNDVFSGNLQSKVGVAQLSLAAGADKTHSISATFDNPFLKGLSFAYDGKIDRYTAAFVFHDREYRFALGESMVQKSSGQKSYYDLAVYLPSLSQGFAQSAPLVSVSFCDGEIENVALNYGSQRFMISAGMGGVWGPPEKALSLQGLISQIDTLFPMAQPQVKPGEPAPKPLPNSALPSDATTLGYYISFLRQSLGSDVTGVTFFLDDEGKIDKARFMLKGKNSELRLEYYEDSIQAMIRVNGATLRYFQDDDHPEKGFFSGEYTVITEKGSLTGTLIVNKDGLDSTQIVFERPGTGSFPVRVALSKVAGKDDWDWTATVAERGSIGYHQRGEAREIQVGLQAQW